MITINTRDATKLVELVNYFMCVVVFLTVVATCDLMRDVEAIFHLNLTGEIG